MMKKHIYNLEFTEEELQMIYLVFSRLETKCFAKWRALWPDDGERASSDCTKQWLIQKRVMELYRSKMKKESAVWIDSFFMTSALEYWLAF